MSSIGLALIHFSVSFGSVPYWNSVEQIPCDSVAVSGKPEDTELLFRDDSAERRSTGAPAIDLDTIAQLSGLNFVKVGESYELPSYLLAVLVKV